MKKRLTRIAPLRAGIVLGILYGFLALLFAAVQLIASKTGHQPPGGAEQMGVFGVLMPFLSAAVGFVGGVLAAVLYNLIARRTGGLEFEVTDVPPTA